MADQIASIIIIQRVRRRKMQQQDAALDLLLTRALETCNEDSKRIKAETSRIEEELNRLYIRTSSELMAALQHVDVQVDVKRVLRGLLLPAVEAELTRLRARSRWQDSNARVTEAEKKKKKKTTLPWKPPPKLKRVLEIVRADMTQLSAIDQISQTFRATIFIIMKISKGALDSSLTKDFEGFPLDDDGRPTFRPSAKWYLAQITFPNGRDLKEIETKVTTAGEDLQLIKRIEGEFFKGFQLQRFPFDTRARRARLLNPPAGSARAECHRTPRAECSQRTWASP